MSMDTILVAVGDGDADRIDAFAETASDIAGSSGADVAIAYGFESDEYEAAKRTLEFDDDDEVTPDEIAKRKVTVRQLGDALDAAGLESSPYGRVENGETMGERIVNFAKALEFDLVIVGGRKRSPAGKAVFGSTAQEVMLNAPCPVTFVRSD